VIGGDHPEEGQRGEGRAEAEGAAADDVPDLAGVETWEMPANNREAITARLLVRLYDHPTRILHHPAPPLHSFAARLPCLIRRRIRQV
jgi:hypothetical protein